MDKQLMLFSEKEISEIANKIEKIFITNSWKWFKNDNAVPNRYDIREAIIDLLMSLKEDSEYVESGRLRIERTEGDEIAIIVIADAFHLIQKETNGKKEI